MIKKQINQKDSFDIELLNSIGYDYVFNNSPINRLKNKINTPKIRILRNLIQKIYLVIFLRSYLTIIKKILIL